MGILRLHQDYSERVIARALEEALACHCYQVDGVAELVRRQAEPGQRPAPLPADALSVPVQEPVAWPDVAQFNRLLAEGGAS